MRKKKKLTFLLILLSVSIVVIILNISKNNTQKVKAHKESVNLLEEKNSKEEGLTHSNEKSTNTVTQTTEEITQESIPVSEAISKLPAEFQKVIRIPKTYPFEVIKNYAFVDELHPPTSTFQFTEIIETKTGFFQIRAVRPAPNIMDKQYVEYREIEIFSGQKAYYQDNGQVQMIKWLDEVNDTYYWVVGNKDINNKEEKLTEDEIKMVVNLMSTY